MNHHLVAEIEIEINFAATAVRVRRHRIPDTAGLEFGEAHDQLAALDAFRMDVAIDPAPVDLGHVTDRLTLHLRTPYHGSRMLCMSRCAYEIEGRLSGRAVFKGDILLSLAD